MAGEKKRPVGRLMNLQVFPKLLCFDDSSCSVEAAHPVAVLHAFDADLGASTRGVQEVAVTKVNADVRESPAHGVEEHEITGFEFVQGNMLANLALLAGGARQVGTDAFLEHHLHETAAVEAGFDVAATHAISHANELQAFENDVLGSAGVAFEERE